MKKITTFLLLLSSIVLIATSCEEKTSQLLINEDKAPVVTQFVYDGMSAFYLWNNEIGSKKPTSNDQDPEKYFYNILNKTDTDHGWSWITDDVESLLGDFAGEATGEFGFNVLALWSNESRKELLGFVRYVLPGTPADAAGVTRGNIISKINGKAITPNNYHLMYGSSKQETFTLLDQHYGNPREVKLSPANYSANPIFYHDIFDDEKTGYLFYTGFKSNFNDKLFHTFTEFKNAGVTNLILDLRYNPGGDISAATYLSSLIAPKATVESKSTFSIMSYNEFVNSEFDKNKWNRSSKLGTYDSKREPNPLDANLDLKRVYIIAQRSSASASELVTFCLRPFMDVIHIGEKTAGKYTASWTIHAYNNFVDKNGDPHAQVIYKESNLSATEKYALKNWAMQPIVGRYTDKNNKDFITDSGLIPNYPIESQEYNTESWKQIGDREDYLLSKAISLITGKPYIAGTTKGSVQQAVEDDRLLSPSEKIIRQSVQLTSPGVGMDR